MIQSVSSKTEANFRHICQVLDLPRSSFYHTALPTPTQEEDQTLGDKLVDIFNHHCGCYSYRRIYLNHKELRRDCSPARVRRLMRGRGLIAPKSRQYVPKTSDGRVNAPAANRVINIKPTTPNEIWVGEITYIRSSNGWLYLAVVLDLYSRRLIDWSLADHTIAGRVCEALKKAIATSSRTRGVIFYSDRGSQYGIRQFRKLLKNFKMLQSMFVRINPYDNVWTESFIGTIKKNGSLDPTSRTLSRFVYNVFTIWRATTILNANTPR
jgi:transposase InsO family protein